MISAVLSIVIVNIAYSLYAKLMGAKRDVLSTG